MELEPEEMQIGLRPVNAGQKTGPLGLKTREKLVTTRRERELKKLLLGEPQSRVWAGSLKHRSRRQMHKLSGTKCCSSHTTLYWFTLKWRCTPTVCKSARSRERPHKAVNDRSCVHPRTAIDTHHSQCKQRGPCP